MPITAPEPSIRGPPELPPPREASVCMSLRPVPLSVRKRLMLPVVTVASFWLKEFTAVTVRSAAAG
jgi:hypothetical protein